MITILSYGQILPVLLLSLLNFDFYLCSIGVNINDVAGKVYSRWEHSSLQSTQGHYPLPYCGITNAMLNATDGVFYYRHEEDLHSKTCELASGVWDLKNKANLDNVQCAEMYDTGYVYTMFYWYGSNYYHLHWDMLLPLYQEVYHRKTPEKSKRLVFMPSVESSRLKKINWETDAFENQDKYWVQIAKFLTGEHAFRPLHKKLLTTRENICFREVKFGTPRVSFGDQRLVQSFRRYVMAQFKINETFPEREKVGIISRSNRRLILNEQELVDALQPIASTELVVLDGLTFQEQVEAMQQYTVLAGMNGAGLMNCVYLPNNSVCIQMVPYKAHLNYEQYSELLKARGPYMEWHNMHEELDRPTVSDTNRNRPDTFVHIEEFKELIRQALAKARLSRKDEL